MKRLVVNHHVAEKLIQALEASVVKVRFWYVLNRMPWDRFRALVDKCPIDPLLADASGFCTRTASLRELYSGAREKNPEIFQQLEQEWRAQRSRWRHYVTTRPWILAVIDHSDVLTPPEPRPEPSWRVAPQPVEPPPVKRPQRQAPAREPAPPRPSVPARPAPPAAQPVKPAAVQGAQRQAPAREPAPPKPSVAARPAPPAAQPVKPAAVQGAQRQAPAREPAPPKPSVAARPAPPAAQPVKPAAVQGAQRQAPAREPAPPKPSVAARPAPPAAQPVKPAAVQGAQRPAPAREPAPPKPSVAARPAPPAAQPVKPAAVQGAQRQVPAPEPGPPRPLAPAEPAPPAPKPFEKPAAELKVRPEPAPAQPVHHRRITTDGPTTQLISRAVRPEDAERVRALSACTQRSMAEVLAGIIAVGLPPYRKRISRLKTLPQRLPRGERVSTYVSGTLAARVKTLATETGRSVSDTVAGVISSGLDRYEQ